MSNELSTDFLQLPTHLDEQQEYYKFFHQDFKGEAFDLVTYSQQSVAVRTVCGLLGIDIEEAQRSLAEIDWSDEGLNEALRSVYANVGGILAKEQLAEKTAKKMGFSDGATIDLVSVYPRAMSEEEIVGDYRAVSKRFLEKPPEEEKGNFYSPDLSTDFLCLPPPQLECPACKGDGWVVLFMYRRDCYLCKGEKTVDEETHRQYMKDQEDDS